MKVAKKGAKDNSSMKKKNNSAQIEMGLLSFKGIFTEYIDSERQVKKKQEVVKIQVQLCQDFLAKSK